LGFVVWVLGFGLRVYGLEYMVQGIGFRAGSLLKNAALGIAVDACSRATNALPSLGIRFRV
jgi:hypothetical protein